MLAEALRKMGDGTMANVRWARRRDALLHLRGHRLRDRSQRAFHPRACTPASSRSARWSRRSPSSSIPNFDSFWVSPDGKNLLLNKGGRNIFLYYLTLDDFHASGSPALAPLPLPAPRHDGAEGDLVHGQRRHDALRDPHGGRARHGGLPPHPGRAGARTATFARTDDTGVLDITLSPDGTRAALMSADGVTWKDYATWQDKGKMAHPSPLHVLWLGDDELLVAGRILHRALRGHGAAPPPSLALSQPGEFGHANDGARPSSTRLTDRIFSFDEAAGAWKTADAYAVRDKSVASDNYRVYLEPSARGSYANLLMVRDAKGSARRRCSRRRQCSTSRSPPRTSPWTSPTCPTARASGAAR